MPDIRDLLDAAAPDVDSGPDLAALERRAITLRRRQHVLRAVPAAAFVLVLSALVMTRPTGTPDELREAEEGVVESTPRPATPTVDPGAPQGAGVDDAGQGSEGVSIGASSARPAPSLSGTRSSTRPPAPTPTAYPAKPSCRVDTVGLPAGQTRSCSFTATQDGGYRRTAAHPGNFVAGSHWVEVTRDGRTTRYGDGLHDSCGSDVIEPGDLVTVAVYRTDGNVTHFEMAAGEGYHCGSG